MAMKCVHKPCGKVFTDAEAEDCHYHPGAPVFHEGQKGWQCCKPRVLTFDEFMAIPPCTTGKHSTTEVPPPIAKPAAEISPAPTYAPQTTTLPTRAPVAAPAVPTTPAVPIPESSDDDASLTIPDGKTCRRKTCGVQYKVGADRTIEKCVFHPGVPIFHEGSKGYTCCKRRVLEFDEFMRIEGCKTKERHLFIGSGKGKGAGKGAGGEEIVDTVRHDFYQTETTVIASLFLKKIIKDKSTVDFSSPTTVTLDLLTSDATPKRYKAAIELYAAVDGQASSFKIMGTKLELTLVKADGTSWPVFKADEPRTGEIIQVGKAGVAS